MWWRSVYLKSVRDTRVAILGWGIGLGLVVFATLASVSTVIGTPEARATLANLATSFAWNADPAAVDTVGGYTTWKLGISILILAIWPLLAGSRMLRGEEERGALDVLLSVPRGRTRVALEKLAAMWTALLGMALLIALLTYGGGAAVKADYGLADALLFGLNLGLIGAVVGGCALLVSQFTRERGTAAGITGGLLLVAIALDMLHRVAPNSGASWLSRLSPVYYYNLSKPLVPSYGTNAGAMLLLLVLAVVLSGAAVLLFARRDIGAPVALPAWLSRSGSAATTQPVARPLPVADWSLRSVYARGVRMLAWPTAWWTLAIAGFAAWMVVLVQQAEGDLDTLLSASSTMSSVVEGLGGGTSRTSATTLSELLLSALFTILPLLLMAFAVTQINRWSADADEGRLDLVLSTAQPRVRVLLARYAALATATLAISLLTLAATAAAARWSGLPLEGGNLAAASLGMVPLALLTAGIGYLASGWLRSAADTGLLSFLLLAWFLINFVGPELSWPESTLRLSPLTYYGTPLLNGVHATDMLALLAVAAATLAIGTLRFARKDL